ncbi:MAG: GNAT family N-acetyltransferase [Cetobacterium sp.]
MIRKLEKKDIDRVAQIWFEANKEAHNFIPEIYWEGKYEEVKTMLPEAEVHVYEVQGEIEGFVGVVDTYIAGIFVSNLFQSRGIGKALLDYIKSDKSALILSVYKRNERAKRFYEREGFKVISEKIDENTSEEEFVMRWKKL